MDAGNQKELFVTVNMTVLLSREEGETVADLDKTINDLERDRQLIYGLNLKSISDHIGDAIELLKEQEEKIYEKEKEIGFLRTRIPKNKAYTTYSHT